MLLHFFLSNGTCQNQMTYNALSQFTTLSNKDKRVFFSRKRGLVTWWAKRVIHEQVT